MLLRKLMAISEIFGKDLVVFEYQTIYDNVSKLKEAIRLSHISTFSTQKIKYQGVLFKKHIKIADLFIGKTGVQFFFCIIYDFIHVMPSFLTVCLGTETSIRISRVG